MIFFKNNTEFITYKNYTDIITFYRNYTDIITLYRHYTDMIFFINHSDIIAF